MAVERFGEFVERVIDVTDDPDLNRVVRVDLGREPMDMDDLLVALRIDPNGSNSCNS